MCEPNCYPLGYSQQEERRLAAHAELLGDLTEDVLRRAGIAAGMRVLDLGCGVGDVSFLAARLVGEAGTVLGVDRAAASINIARQRAENLRMRHARFEVAELNAFDATEQFDAVIGRFVLLYQPDATAILRRFRRVLHPGGIMAFQELDMETVSQEPTSELFERVRSWILSGFTAGGTELNMGSRLLKTFLASGLARPTMIGATLVAGGPESPLYEQLAQLVRSLLPLLERAGIATPEEVAIATLADRLRQDAIAGECLWFWPRVIGAWPRAAL